MRSEQLDAHPYFSAWSDPASGERSYILTERVAPLQKSFYFVNSSLSPDGKWLWFEAAHPPAPYKCLAVVGLDPDHPEIRYFPYASMSAETPVLDAEGRVYFVMSETADTIWRMDVEGTLESVFTLPEEFVRGRTIRRLGTHLTLSPDGGTILFDGKVGNTWYVATVCLADGSFHLIKEFARHYNHAQFSPTDPTLFSIAQDHWRDPVTGTRFWFDLRIWLMSPDGERFEPALPTLYHAPSQAGNEVCHEWFADDGTLCWMRYRDGAFEMDMATREVRHVWKRPLCHAHCDPSRRFWVADQSPYAWPTPVQLLFFDRETQEERILVSGMPAPCCHRPTYHIDPHPRFIDNGSAIVYTTTVRGCVDLALSFAPQE